MSPYLTTAQAELPLLAGRRVLVVEDEYFLADDITQSLKSSGALIVGPIAYIQDALDIVDANATIDGAVLDINVGSEMVFPLARALRSRNVPFVFTTGYDQSVVESEFRDIELWEKPINTAAMVRALAGLIAGARPWPMTS
jgi:CheY-like chemotaxis protein